MVTLYTGPLALVQDAPRKNICRVYFPGRLCYHYITIQPMELWYHYTPNLFLQYLCSQVLQAILAGLKCFV